MDHFCILLTDGSRLHVDNGHGPLVDFDPDVSDPADGADALWRAIDNHDPIYVDGFTAPGFNGPETRSQRVWYPNARHVVAITEITRQNGER